MSGVQMGLPTGLCLLFALLIVSTLCSTVAWAHEIDSDEEEALDGDFFANHPYLDANGEVETEEDARTPIRNYTRRRLTLPAKTLRILAGPGDHRTLSLSSYRGFGDYGIGAESRRLRFRDDTSRFSTGETIGTLRLGVAYGITDDWEVGAGLPLTFGPGAVDFSDNPPVFTTLRIGGRANFEIGLRATVFTPIAQPLAVQLGVPIAYRKPIFRLDSGVFITVHADEPATSRVLIPARATVSFVDAMYVGLSGALDIRNVDALAIPLGFHVIFTIPYDHVIMDLGFSFTWPAFVHVFRENGDEDERVGEDVSDSLGQILGRQGVDFNDFDVQLGANVVISF